MTENVIPVTRHPSRKFAKSLVACSNTLPTASNNFQQQSTLSTTGVLLMSYLLPSLLPAKNLLLTLNPAKFTTNLTS